MWRGKEWKSMYQDAFPSSSKIHPSKSGVESSLEKSGIYNMERIKFDHWLACSNLACIVNSSLIDNAISLSELLHGSIWVMPSWQFKKPGTKCGVLEQPPN